MFFKSQLKWILLSCCGFSLQSMAQQRLILSPERHVEPNIHVQPNKCVALNQGRDCFTSISIRWQLQEKRDYCLFLQELEESPRLIKCWEGLSHGQWQHEFQSATDSQFLLREKNSETILASAFVQVSWLYKATTRKRRWRLF